MSNSRKQIEAWLSTLEISGSVLDVGGLFWPVKGRTKTWDVTDYRILDIKGSRNGVKADYVFDLNDRLAEFYEEPFDNAFLVEVTDHFWNPVVAFQNVNRILKKGGLLYISSNFLFPQHTGFDCIRLTRTGLEKILIETGFQTLSVSPRYAKDESLSHALDLESKIQYRRSEIGYMVKALKL